MKKCSTAALLLAAALGAPAHAGRTCAFLPDAPPAHRVRPGDTLWDIAALFLQDPWCWPRVWDSNRAQVANPHWIYPGQTIVLDRRAGRLMPAGAEGARDQTSDHANGHAAADVRLSPALRTSALSPSQPVPAVAPSLLQGAARYRLASAAELANAPRIRGFVDGRSIAGAGDVALVEGTLVDGNVVDGEAASGTAYEVVRSLDPTVAAGNGKDHPSERPLLRVGTARYLRQQDSSLHLARIGPARAEVMAGDLLLRAPATGTAAVSLQPAKACEGRIVALLREGGQGMPGDVVLLNRGIAAGLVNGSLVAVSKQVRIGADESRHARQTSEPIADPVATLLVFDALDQSALALVLQATDSVGRGDAIGSPPAAD